MLYREIIAVCSEIREKIKFTLEQATNTLKGNKGIVYIFCNLGARWSGWSTSRAGRLTPRKETRYQLCRRVGGGPSAGLDGCGKSRPHRDSIHGPSNP
jgi:hypothetical protein